jgi:type II secretory pathway predicted ATPase ExeA
MHRETGHPWYGPCTQALDSTGLGQGPRALADAEGLIAAELQRSTRLVIVPGAHMLRTLALQALYGLWAHGVPNHFALVLAGDERLGRVLQRPGLASLNSCVFIRHRLSAA